MTRSIIVDVTGLTDGANKSFTTPSRYVAGTLRVVWNAAVYDPSDPRKGWTETSDQSFDTFVAPVPDDNIQAFYEEKDDAGQLGLDDVKGSPFHPNNLYP